jgi:ubiquinone biosynthesis protein COQ9
MSYLGSQTAAHDCIFSFKKNTVPVKGFNNWSIVHTREKLGTLQQGFSSPATASKTPINLVNLAELDRSEDRNQ